MGRLTTHVLDTARGCPAADVPVSLYRLGADGSHALVRRTATNRDGRTDAPLLGEDEFKPGTYEIVFEIGPYFADLLPADTTPFLESVPLRVTLGDAAAHYHVPLLASPWSFSTYRGS